MRIIMKNFQKASGKKAMRFSAIVLLFIIALSLLCFQTYASGYYIVNCLVAYDEEWASTAFWKYAYSAEELASIIFDGGTYYFWFNFNIDFRIRAWASWDSYDDPATADEMMNETRDDIGYSRGMIINGYTIHCLIAFTDQAIPDPFGSPYYACYGYSDHIEGIILVSEYTTWTKGQHTDNILQHELSHFYGIRQEDEHSIEGLDCVMNVIRDVWCPLPDHHMIPHCMVTHNWCEDCFNTIMQNRANFGYWFEIEGGGRWGLRCVK